jgi:uncharacterized protein (TIGR02646 family)
MRRISTATLQPPADWATDAQDALTEVEKLAIAPRRQRNAEIERHATKTWRALKELLAALSFDKCWYCEIRQDRSLKDVDHFRPKGKVLGLSSHPGYWWLAFDVDNYRFSCNLCNRRTTDSHTGLKGGKHEQFPIFDESKRAKSKQEDYRLEEPMLLDPLVPSDPGLLTWQVNGDPAPRFTAAQNQRFHDRAAVSIRVYHLDHHKLRIRRRKIYNDLKLLVQEGDLIYAQAATGQPFLQASIDRVTQSIIEMINDAAELSASATQYLLEFRLEQTSRTWLDLVISSA